MTNGAEDGLIEFMCKDNGANTIVARLTHTDLKLINGTGLEVAGSITASGGIVGYIDSATIAATYNTIANYNALVAATVFNGASGFPNTSGANFSTVAPTSSVTPSSANDITNKTYVDAQKTRTFLATAAADVTGLFDTNFFMDLSSSIADSTGEISIDGSDVEQINIGATGVYQIDASARVQGNSRVELTVQLHVDSGSGFVAQTQHIASDYVVRDSDQNDGGVTLSTLVSLNSGDKIKFDIAVEVDGGSPANDCRLLQAGSMVRIIRHP